MSNWSWDDIEQADEVDESAVANDDTDFPDDCEQKDWIAILSSEYADMSWRIVDKRSVERSARRVSEGSSYVYILWREDRNEPFYVGIGQKDRVLQHGRRTNHHPNIIKDNIIAKLRRQGLDIRYIMPIRSISQEEAKLIEIDLIKRIGRKNLGTGPLANMTDGGDGLLGMVFTDEHKAKIVASNQNTWQNEELRAVIGAKSSAAWNLPGAREARTAKMRERFSDPEYCARLSDSLKLVYSAPEMREKAREAAAKRNSVPGYGAKISAAKKAKMCAAVPENFPQILRLRREAAGMSVSDLARALGTSPSNVSAYEHGKRTPSQKYYDKILVVFPDLES